MPGVLPLVRAIEDQDTQAAVYLLNRLIPARKGTLLELAGLHPVRDAHGAAEAAARILALGRLLDAHELGGLRADVDRLLEHAGLPSAPQPGEVAGNGHARE